MTVRSNPEKGRAAAPSLLPDHPAYVIYTSGSTGVPKGVVVSHRALANRVRYAAAADRAEAFLQKTTIGFDVSVVEIFGPLLCGGRTVLARPGGQRDSAYLVRLIAEEQVSHASFPPTLIDVLLAEGALDDCRALRIMVTGGEAVPPSLPERFYARLQGHPGIALVNRYGPTEATVSITAWRAGPEPPGRTLPIGRPTASAEVHLLSAGLRPVPIGVAGEICLGGVCLARGYLGQPALTAEKWVPHPFCGEPDARLYRTGDLARFRSDGAVEFLGRVDQQVKVRGFRIELDEIAAVLASHEAVGETVAAVREDGGAGRQLVAYWVPRGSEGSADILPDEAELRAFLQRRLPEYMLPARFVALPSLPTTRTGKVDRAALPVPPRPAGAAGGPGGPRNPAQEVLAAVWARVLGVEPAAGDNFFALGGHSLAAVQVMSRVREAFGVELPLRALFEEPTLGALARRIEAAQRARAGLPAGPALVRAVSGGGEDAAAVPLSFAQERLWFLDRLEPGNAAYNMPAAFRLDGPLDAVALAASLAEVERRHGSLRTVFRAGEEGPEQVVLAARPRPLPRVDLAGLPAAARDAELQRLAEREAATPFDLSAGPLWRVVLAPLGEGAAALLVTLHHIVGDGWSIGVLIREVAALYRAFAAGEPSPLPELPVQYTDYAVWQRRWLGEAAGPEGGLAFWRRQLEGVPALALPADRPRPAEQTHAGAQQPLHLGAGASEALVRLARQGSATPFMVLLAGFGALLGRVSGQDDFAVGTFVANRTRPEIEGLIGFFVNNLALRTRLDGDPDFGALVGRARETALGAFAAQDLPFEAVLEGLRTERSLARPPLFQVMLVLQNMPMERLALGGVTFSRLPAAAGRANFDLTLWMSEEADGFAGQLEFNRDLFEAATAARWSGHLAVLLGAAAADPGLRLSDLPLLDAAERWQVLGEWSPGPAAGPGGAAGQTVAGLFAARAAAAPDAVAVVGGAPGDHHLSYGELARAAGALAGRLAAAGIGPESAVGVALDRSPEMVAAVLGILAAGGFYVPLDLASPPDRRAAILADAGAGILLTERRFALPPAAGRVQWLLDGPAPEGEPAAPAPSAAMASTAPLPLAGRSAPGHLAYAIYTSGSTGAPKGVLVEHRSLAHHTRDAAAVFGIGPGDRVLQLAALSFDASAEEIWPCLASGATLVLRDPGPIAAPRDLLARCGETAVTVLDLPTAYWHELTLALEDGTAALPASLRLTILGGERARPERWAAWRRAAPGVRLVNTYGPTEATVVATRAELDPAAAPAPVIGELPIGRAISGVQAYVLDRGLRLLPAGVPGELCLGGAGLARGYLHRPGLTAERFVPDPFAGADAAGGAGARQSNWNGGLGARLYRTGDLARWRPDGRLEFVGRVDQQVKIRGFRVEPGEVEAALAAHPDVAAAAVAARGDLPGGLGLAAYLAPRPGADLSPEALRGFLAGRLPDHMIPAVWMVLPELPLGAGGKVDRRALPAPERGRPQGNGFVAPRSPVESLLAEIWSDLLQVERVGVYDSFFQLGGHSLLATRLVSRIHLALEVDFPLRSLFEAPSLAEMALAVEELVIARLETLNEEELARLE